MSLQEIIAKGTIISTGAAQTINIPEGADTFILRNRTTLAAGAGIIESIWWSGMAAGTAQTNTLAAGTITNTIIAAGGFTYTDPTTAVLGPAIAITGITQAASAVAATATTPVVGQIVRVYGTTGMLQVAGMDFSVTAVTPGVSMTFGYLNSAGFAAPATGGNYRLLPFDLPFYPRKRFITGITAAAQAVVTMSVAHDYQIGDKVRFVVPAAFGMTQMNGLTGTVTAIAAGTITVDINSSAFTAFAFPTSAIAAAGVTFAQVVPAGEVATSLLGAIRDVNSRKMFLGANIAGTANDIIDYWAIRSEVV
jgi:hypothetical protein